MDLGEEKTETQEFDKQEADPKEYPFQDSGASLNIWHLILIFFGGIGVCVLFFALGFLIGKNQGKMEQIIAAKPQETKLSADISPAAGSGTSEAPSSTITDSKSGTQSKLDFYSEVNRNFKSELPVQEIPAGASGSQMDSKSPPASTTPLEPEAKPKEPPIVSPPVTNPPELPKAAPEAVPAAAASPTEMYRVQVGAFRTQDESQNLVIDLEKKGYEAFIEPPTGYQDNLYRVQMGPYTSRAKAAEVIGRLKKSGLNALLKKY